MMATTSNLRSAVNADVTPARLRSSFRFNRTVPQVLCVLLSLGLILLVLRGVLANATMGRWWLGVSGVTLSALMGWGVLRGVRHLQRRIQPVDCLPIYATLALLCGVVGLATWPSAPAPVHQALNAAPMAMLELIAPFAATELKGAEAIRAECHAAQPSAPSPACPQTPKTSDLR